MVPGIESGPAGAERRHRAALALGLPCGKTAHGSSTLQLGRVPLLFIRKAVAPLLDMQRVWDLTMMHLGLGHSRCILGKWTYQTGSEKDGINLHGLHSQLVSCMSR